MALGGVLSRRRVRLRIPFRARVSVGARLRIGVRLRVGVRLRRVGLGVRARVADRGG